MTAKQEKDLLKAALVAIVKKKTKKKNCCIRCIKGISRCISAIARMIKACFYLFLMILIEGYQFITEGLLEKFMKKTKCFFTAFGMVDGKYPILTPRGRYYIDEREGG